MKTDNETSHTFRSFENTHGPEPAVRGAGAAGGASVGRGAGAAEAGRRGVAPMDGPMDERRAANG